MLRLFIFCVSQTYLISVARVQLKILASCCTTRVKMQVNIALVNCDHGLTYLVGSSSHKQKFISFINGISGPGQNVYPDRTLQADLAQVEEQLASDCNAELRIARERV